MGFVVVFPYLLVSTLALSRIVSLAQGRGVADWFHEENQVGWREWNHVSHELLSLLALSTPFLDSSICFAMLLIVYNLS